LISKKDSSGILFYLYDNIGNTVATVNWDGTINTRYEFDAFGKVRQTTGTNGSNNNKFVGGYGIIDDSDDDGLIYMRARYYDSDIGRFISRDIVEIPGRSSYIYCNNNPIVLMDPSGLLWICEKPLDSTAAMIVTLGNGAHVFVVFEKGEGAGNSYSFQPEREKFRNWGQVTAQENVDSTEKSTGYVHIDLSEEEETKLFKAFQDYNKDPNRPAYGPTAWGKKSNSSKEMKKIFDKSGVKLPCNVKIDNWTGIEGTGVRSGMPPVFSVRTPNK